MSKNTEQRFRIIDECLQNRMRKWTWQDLLSRVNQRLQTIDPALCIGKSTLFKDIRDMQRIHNVEIEKFKNGRKIYYRYTGSRSSIYDQTLTMEEMHQLTCALGVLMRFKGLPQFDWLNEILPKLQTRLGLSQGGKEIISFESNMYYQGLQHLPAVFNAIINKRVLRISYKDFKNNKPTCIDLHPQYVKQFNSRWFVMSFVDKWKDKPQTHALDRIMSVEELDEAYHAMEFDWELYFSDMIGVSKYDNTLLEVKLLILDDEQASYIATKPLHESQKPIRKTSLGYETMIKVSLNYELIKLLLSFGDRIKVIGPSQLVDIIKGKAKGLFDQYFPEKPLTEKL